MLETQSLENITDCDTPEIAQSLEWTFAEDRKTLDSATPVGLRLRFREWAAAAEQSDNPRYEPPVLGHLPSSRYRYFVHVDEQALRSFLNPGEGAASMAMERGWVNLVDSRWKHMEDEGRDGEDPELESLYGCTDDYVGCMKVPGHSLNHSFYDILGSMSEFWYTEYERPPGMCRGG